VSQWIAYFLLISSTILGASFNVVEFWVFSNIFGLFDWVERNNCFCSQSGNLRAVGIRNGLI
jgi:hypothetical protein